MKVLIIRFMCWFSLILSLDSCNKTNLTDLNINPNTQQEIDPELQLAKAQLLNETHQNAFVPLMYYVPGYVQHFAAINGVMSFGDKYLMNRPEDLNSFYSNIYTNAVLNLTDIINKSKDDPKKLAVYAMARIMRVFVMHRLTDMYGDIIYFDAGAGFSSGNLLPKFDAQKDIYGDMLKELFESANDLRSTTASLKNPVQDLFYQGDKIKWIKFANSLMLRLALRMIKADPNATKEWVHKSIAGGLMTGNEDNAVLAHSDGPGITSRNPFSQLFEFVETSGQKLSKTLIDFLKNRDDPRLMLFTMGIGPVGGPFDTNPAHQKGMPNGYDDVSILTYEGLPASGSIDIDTVYSTVNLELFARTAPSVYLTYAETELMLAEAAELGFIEDNAAIHYNNGVTAAMKMYGIFGPSFTISDDAIGQYLADQPYLPGSGLKMIGEQYWVVNFTNPIEAWSNWRRTGFPELVSVNYPGSMYNVQIPRRFLFPATEAAVNSDNYQDMISRQGADDWNTRIWWDK